MNGNDWGKTNSLDLNWPIMFHEAYKLTTKTFPGHFFALLMKILISTISPFCSLVENEICIRVNKFDDFAAYDVIFAKSCHLPLPLSKSVQGIIFCQARSSLLSFSSFQWQKPSSLAINFPILSHRNGKVKKVERTDKKRVENFFWFEDKVEVVLKKNYSY